MALTVDQLRERIESSLGDEALGALLAAAYQAITREIGPAQVVELLTPDAGDLLLLSRPAASIEAIVERGITLDEADYSLRGQRMLVRMVTGPHPSRRWRGRIDVTYVTDDDAERDRMATALVQLDLNYRPSVVSQRLGEYSETYAQGDRTYARERESILASYDTGGAFV